MKKARVKICKLCKQMYWRNKKIHPVKVKEYDVEVTEIVCKGCEPKPFQGLVQLRGFKEPVLGDFEKSLKKVVKVKKVRDAWDLQFASARSAHSYYKWLKKRMPELEVKRTRSHVTTKEGKKMFRPTFCLRKPKRLNEESN